MSIELEELSSMLLSYMKLHSVLLTGWLRSSIRIDKVEGNKVVIAIDPPTYDLDLYVKEGIFRCLGDGTSYANETNTRGTRFRPTQTKNWVNTNCVRLCRTYANTIKAKVINKLPINENWRG